MGEPFWRGMRLLSANVLFAGLLGAGSLLLVGGAGLSQSAGRRHAPPASPPAKITFDYPLEGSVFPPEITPPTFLWRDASETAKRWEKGVRGEGRERRVSGTCEKMCFEKRGLGMMVGK
jgi:hypothetical protein